MSRARRGMVLVALVASLVATAPPAVADSAEEVGPPFSFTGKELACGAPANFFGSPMAPAPRPPIARGAVPVKCTASHQAERAGLLGGSLSVRGTGTATDGSSSSVMSYGYSRHRIRSVDNLRYEVTFKVEDAVAEVPVTNRLSTASYVALFVSASHTACRSCKGDEFLVVADSEARSTTPERVRGETHTLSIDVSDVAGKRMPAGTIGIVVAVFPIIMTGSYATPLDVVGSGSARVRVTRIAAMTR